MDRSVTMRWAALAACLVGTCAGLADQPTTQAAQNRAAPLRPVVVYPSQAQSESDIQFFPLSEQSGPGRDLGRAGSSKQGWAKRVFTDWARRREKSEDAPSLFERFRKEKERPSDSLLVSRCRAILAGEPSLRGAWIHVAADAGVVRLTGSVPSESTKRAAEQAARRTPGAADILNELTVVSQTSEAVRASYTAAALNPPLSLDGTLINQAPANPGVAKPAVILGQPVQIAGREGLPSVRTYVIRRPEAAPAMAAMPPVSNDSKERLVAKAAVAPAALPSGFQVWSPSNARPIIPARPPNQPGQAGNPISPPAWVRAAPRAGIDLDSKPSDRALETDVAALLAADPRATALRFDVRGAEILLSGSIRTPEDLYDLSKRLNSLPGVDFVSFENVQFTF